MTPEKLLSLIDYGSPINGQPLTKADQIELIRKAKSEWCKQQRENCHKAWQKSKAFIKEPDAILNAPEP